MTFRPCAYSPNATFLNKWNRESSIFECLKLDEQGCNKPTGKLFPLLSLPLDILRHVIPLLSFSDLLTFRQLNPQAEHLIRQLSKCLSRKECRMKLWQTCGEIGYVVSLSFAYRRNDAFTFENEDLEAILERSIFSLLQCVTVTLLGSCELLEKVAPKLPRDVTMLYLKMQRYQMNTPALLRSLGAFPNLEKFGLDSRSGTSVN